MNVRNVGESCINCFREQHVRQIKGVYNEASAASVGDLANDFNR